MANRSTKISFFKPSVPQRITNLNWKQARERFPFLKPYGDADRDGLMNFLDCKPFDIRRQGKKHDEEISVGFDTIKEFKTIGDIQKLEKSMLKKEEDEDE